MCTHTVLEHTVSKHTHIIPYSTCTHTHLHAHTHTHNTHKHTFLMHTHTEKLSILSISHCPKGEGNCCGSWATERQPSVWLIGISRQRSVESTESNTELLTIIEQSKQDFCLDTFSVFFFWKFYCTDLVTVQLLMSAIWTYNVIETDDYLKGLFKNLLLSQNNKISTLMLLAVS